MMTCNRIEEWIPLYVEGDLGEPQASQLQAHAQTCEACGALLAQYESSQAWLRAEATPVFDEAFVDTVRAGVMREITAIRLRRPFVERLRDWIAPRRVVLASAALMLIFIALAAFIYLSRSRVNHQDAVAQHTPAPPVERESKGTPAPTIDKDKVGLPPKRRTPYRAVQTLAKHAPRNSRRVRVTPASALAQARLVTPPVAPIEGRDAPSQTDERLRIEIQTADPTIRIIWFAPKPTEADAP
jgi:hypothetical protein